MRRFNQKSDIRQSNVQSIGQPDILKSMFSYSDFIEYVPKTYVIGLEPTTFSLQG